MPLLTSLNRLKLLPLLPKNAEVVEVGTAKGGYARRIADITKPKILHLIDPWGDSQDAYAKAYGAGLDPASWYPQVVQMFADMPQVKIHRGYSTNVLPTFAERSMDWVYIDAMHDYKSVSADLLMVERIVKDDGLILGHDFSRNGRKNFGVTQAVLDFLKNRPCYELVAVTVENAPSYVISKEPRSPAAVALRNGILAHGAIAVDTWMLERFYLQSPAISIPGTPRRIMTFRLTGHTPATS